MDYAALAHYRVKHSKNDFSYATLVTLQDANGKNHINGIKNFFSKRVRLIVASKAWLSTRAATCVATAS